MESSYQISYVQQSKSGKFTFSPTELRQIVISVLVLTFAFAMAMTGGAQEIPLHPGIFLVILPISALAVISAFLLHELAHKFLAQKYGCWAEFRYWPMGLLIALLLSAMGFLFAAPGAVMISGYIRKSQYGKISAAGPSLNLSLAAILILSAFLVGPDTLAGFVCSTIGFINAFIGGFNLIPISPFDGSKIYGWNIGVYIALVVTAVALIATYYIWL
jgi:Zn-dependent protease